MSATEPGAIAKVGSIPELAFHVEGAAPAPYTAVPTLRFALRIDSLGGEAIRSVVLNTQIQIAARRRPYDDAARERLFELFGAPEGWGTTLRTLLWTRTTLVVPPFTGTTVADLDVLCTYDLEVTAARYLVALQDGVVPLELLFSGSVFYAGGGGELQTARIPWECEAAYDLPVSVWRQTMERHFPGTAWLRLRKESFDRLSAFKSRRALASWDDALEVLLDREPS